MSQGVERGANQQGILSTLRELIVLLFIVYLIRTIGFGLYEVPTGSMETKMLKGERFFADKFTPLFSPIKHGDIITFNQPDYEYSKNPLIKFFEYYVWGPQNWTKRVIGVPGDRIRSVIENGKPVIYRNDKKLDEPYLNKYPLVYVRKGGGIDVYSYDPSVPFDKQAFYRLDERSMIKGPSGKPLLLEPGTSLNPAATKQACKASASSTWNCTDEFYVELGKNQYWVMGDNRLGSRDSRFWGPLDGSLIHGKVLFRIFSRKMPEDASWFTSWLLIDMVMNPIDFWSRIRWNRLFQSVQ